jgi:hypothetical protein
MSSKGNLIQTNLVGDTFHISKQPITNETITTISSITSNKSINSSEQASNTNTNNNKIIQQRKIKLKSSGIIQSEEIHRQSICRKLEEIENGLEQITINEKTPNTNSISEIVTNSNEQVLTTNIKLNQTSHHSKINLITTEATQSRIKQQHDIDQGIAELNEAMGNITVVTNSETNYSTNFFELPTTCCPLDYRRNIYNPLKGNNLVTKEKNCLRVAYQNINSLRPKNQDKWKMSLERINHLEIDVVGMTETCVNWSNNKARSTYKKSLKRIFTKSNLNISMTQNNIKNDHLPGGTLTLSTNKLVNHWEKDINDKFNMGRWTGTTYRLGDGKKLNIITAYRVIDQKITASNSLSTNSQQFFMLKDRGIDTKPRKQFIDDFCEQFQETCLQEEEYTILMIDANECLLQPESGGMMELIEKCNFVNLYQSFHGDYEPFPTHVNGSRTIDFMFGSQNILPYIMKIGYPRFNELFDSDHRGLYCDLSDKILHEENFIENDPRIRMVGTNSTNREGIKYITSIYEHLISNNIVRKVENLLQKVQQKTITDDTATIALNELDEMITNVMLRSEKMHCKKKGKELWTPEIRQSNLRIQYYHIKLLSERQRVWSGKRIDDIKSHMSTESINMITNNKKHWRAALRQELKNHKVLCKNNHEQRDKYLQKIIDDLKERDDNCHVTVKQLKYREQNRHDFQIIKKVLKGQRSQGIQYLDVPEDPNDEDPKVWNRIIDKNLIEKTILERNVVHFGQAKTTPFAKENLVNLFGYKGVNSESINLMDNNIIPEEISEEDLFTQKFVRKLASGKVANISDEISYEEFRNALNVWNEKTTTSPSGRHLGHYKLLLKLQVLDEDNEQINYSEIILKTYYNIVMISLRLGVPLKRWGEITTCMIEKIPGVSRINKLRVIHIFEADYNLILKVIWSRKTIWQVHNSELLNIGQSGSRPGCRAIDVAIQKEMKYTYSKMTRTPLLTIDNDAKSCFDRILCNVAMLISQYFGVDINACNLQSTNLEKSQFRIRTGLGDSTTTYSHSCKTPIHGTGQGSCSSPAIWLLTSSFIMDLLQENGHGMSMEDVEYFKKIRQQFIEGFVDDNSIFTNLKFGIINLEELLLKGQLDGQIWEKLLSITGGELELKKCFYYIISWGWDKYGSPIAQEISEQKLEKLKLTLSNSGTITELEQKQVYQSHKTLGTYKCVVGKESEQFNYLMKKSNDICDLASKGQFNRRQSWLAYKSCYIPSMTYSLTAVSMNEKQLAIIQKKATTQFSRNCGFEMSFPKAVVHGPTCFGGLGFNNLYVESSIAKIESLICHINKETPLGASMRINLNWVQLHSGLKKPFFISNKYIDYIQENWFLEIRKFLIKCSVTINIKSIWVPQLIREGDRMIMKKLMDHTITKNQRVIINNWRMYFQVCNTAELINYYGNEILPQFINKNRVREYKSRSNIRWPIQEMPNINTLNVWKNYLFQIIKCDRGGRIHKGHRLGPWFDNSNKIMRIPSWVHTGTSKEFIYIHKNDLWYRYGKVKNDYTSTYYSSTGMDIPVLESEINFLELVPVDVLEENNQLLIKNRYISTKLKQKTELPDTIGGNRSTLWEQVSNELIGVEHMFKDTKFSLDNEDSSKEVLNLVFCSDGGVSNDIAGYGVVGSLNNNIIITNKCKLPTIFNKYTSHRSEACGVLSAIIHVQAIVKYQKMKGINNQKIHALLLCDNETVTKTLNKTKYYKPSIKDYFSPDFDIIDEISKWRRNLYNEGIIITIKHIKGHQDRQARELSDHAKLNVHADKLATQSLKMKRKQPNTVLFPDATICINNLHISSNYKKLLRKSYLSMDLRDYLQQSNKWTGNTIDSVWWEVHDIALQSMSVKKWTFIQKFIHNRLPSNERQHTYHNYLSPQCSSCNKETETQHHIFLCTKCPKREKLKRKYKLELNCVLDKHRTNQATKIIILQNVSEWLSTQNYIDAKTIAPDASRTLIKATNEQKTIGWGNWIKGRWSKEWASLQNYDIKNSDSGIKYNSSEKWAKEIIILTWEFIHSMWLERNSCEHDLQGEPEKRKKEKLIEVIIGESEIMEYQDYPKEELDKEKLLQLPKENLQMIENNLKNAKKSKRRSINMLP